MIRHVVLGRLHPGIEPDAIRPALEAVARLRTPGLLAVRAGVDERLRDSTVDFAITCDFTDAEAFLVYDRDEEHDRIRREGILPITAELTRVQFAFDAPA